jgi:hypothetical protein
MCMCVCLAWPEQELRKSFGYAPRGGGAADARPLTCAGRRPDVTPLANVMDVLTRNTGNLVAWLRVRRRPPGATHAIDGGD